jgi:hypothetical protein
MQLRDVIGQGVATGPAVAAVIVCCQAFEGPDYRMVAMLKSALLSGDGSVAVEVLQSEHFIHGVVVTGEVLTLVKEGQLPSAKITGDDCLAILESSMLLGGGAAERTYELRYHDLAADVRAWLPAPRR